MRSTKTAPWPDNTTQVKVDKRDDLNFWANWFHVSKEVLRRAVAAAGPGFQDVHAYLTAKRRGLG